MPYYVACLKHGTYYSADYVNILKNMVKRNTSFPIHFICFTEDPKGIDKEIEVLPLPNMGISGVNKAWWYKLKIFDKTLPYKGTVLFLDLDLVIVRSIDKLFEYHPGKFCIINDYSVRPSSNVVRNSSVFRMEFGSYPHLWDQFVKHKEKIMNRLVGDQNWITEQITDDEIWPQDWVISYRWNYAGRTDAHPSPKEFTADKKTHLPAETSILVFHGPPKPHEVVSIENPDPYIVKHWH